MPDAALEVKGITKAFGGEHALSGVDLRMRAGEIHALLGPNGSGKSTLIRCLSGAQAPDSGTIVVGGRELTALSPRQAFDLGIAVIYQHLSLIGSLSVADNIFLGSERTSRKVLVDRRAQFGAARELLDRVGATGVDPRAPVSSLRVGEQQLVEIAKALRHEPKILILDEPTAALGDAEAQLLGQHLKRLREEGIAMLYVTHLLNEVLDVGDAVTILRDGEVVFSRSIEGLQAADIVRALAPDAEQERSDAASEAALSAAAARQSAVTLRLEEFGCRHAGPVDLEVRGGEIVGIFGLLGSGRTELLEGLFGVGGATRGRVELEGRAFRPRSPRGSLRRGLALVPSDRTQQSILAAMTALENTMLPHLSRLARFAMRARRAERKAFLYEARRLNLKPVRPTAPAWTFSGGNQQKLVLGRWLGAGDRVRVLLLDEPTQGIDLGARLDLYRLVRSFCSEQEGRATVFASSDPEEIVTLANRAVVLHRGRVVGELREGELQERALLSLAHGHGNGSGAASS